MDKIDKILASEFSELFVQGMRDRMVVSYYKYGKLAEAYPHKVNALESLEQHLRKYRETKNLEHLIDAANFVMIEFMYPSYPEAYLSPRDSDASPGRISRVSGKPSLASNKVLCGKEG